VPLRAAFVPLADKLPWVENLKGDMDAENGSGIRSVVNKRVLTPFPFRRTFHGWKSSRVIGTRIMGQDFVPFSINETCPPCPLNVFSDTRKATGHVPVVAKRRPILAQPFKAGTSSSRCVPPADKLPWVEGLKGDMDAENGLGIRSVLNKRVLTPFTF
jgi:hypothetical protein